MQTPSPHTQRRAIVGNRHFILANPEQPDHWALPGPVILKEEPSGQRHYGPAKTISTAQLIDWAKTQNLGVNIDDQFPILRRDCGDNGEPQPAQIIHTARLP